MKAAALNAGGNKDVKVVETPHPVDGKSERPMQRGQGVPATSLPPKTGRMKSLGVFRRANESFSSFIARSLRTDHETLMARDPESARIKMEKISRGPFELYRATLPIFAQRYLDDKGLARPDGTRRVSVPSVGDLHPLNLGSMVGIDGRAVFGPNDYDEAGKLPWDFDIKRCAGAFGTMTRQLLGKNGSSGKEERVVRAFVDGYVRRLRTIADDPKKGLAPMTIDEVGGAVRKLLESAQGGHRHPSDEQLAQVRTAYLDRYLDLSKGEFRPHPLIKRLPAMKDQVTNALKSWHKKLPAELRPTANFEVLDVARKIGSGTGSLDRLRLRSLVVFHEPGGDVFRMMELKEARALTLKPLLSQKAAQNPAARTAAEHRAQLPGGDRLFGHTRIAGVDVIVRERTPMKAEVDPTTLSDKELAEYARTCGEAIAQCHANTGTQAAKTVLAEIDADFSGRRDLQKAIARDAVATADLFHDEVFPALGKIAGNAAAA